jgi:hypothetical protein
VLGLGACCLAFKRASEEGAEGARERTRSESESLKRALFETHTHLAPAA